MGINKLDDWVDRLYAVLRPIIFFLIIQLMVFVVLVLMPQSHDVYTYLLEEDVFLLEEGVFKKLIPILLLFIAIICLSLTSGTGSKLLYCFGSIKLPDDYFEKQVKTKEMSKDEEKEKREELNTKLEKMMLGIITGMFYFPIFSLSVGLFRTFMKGDIPNFEITVLVLLLIGSVYVIYLLRKKLRDYIITKLTSLSKSGDYPYENFLVKKYNGLDNILKDRRKVYSFSKDYEPLFKVVCIFFSLAICTFIVVAFLPSSIYIAMGSSSLIVFGFACWITFYYGIFVIDETVIKPLEITFLKINWSLKRFLVVLLLVSSYFNQDHPLRFLEDAPYQSSVTVSTNYKNYYKKYSSLSSDSAVKKTPIVFIAIDGGANRTGAWSAIMLSKIQDEVPEFKDHIFAISSISGGTLGGNFFNMVEKTGEKPSLDYAKRFFKEDFLSPVVGTFLFGEMIGYFLPFHVEKFDRGIALESGWEDKFVDTKKEIFDSLKTQILADKMLVNPMRNSVSDFNKLNDSTFKTAIFINSHEVETGKRAIWSNVLLDNSFAGITNLNQVLKKDIRYSSAILLSARFPGISPAAMVQINPKQRRHYVDGGYFEASGTLTLYEVMKALEKDSLAQRNEVFVLHCMFDADEEIKEDSGVRFLNEIREITTGGVNDKSGHAEFAVESLKNYVEKSLNGKYIQLKVGDSAKDVPMNWVLSQKAIDKIERQSKKQFDNPNLKELFEAIKKVNHAK